MIGRDAREGGRGFFLGGRGMGVEGGGMTRKLALACIHTNRRLLRSLLVFLNTGKTARKSCHCKRKIKTKIKLTLSGNIAT